MVRLPLLLLLGLGLLTACEKEEGPPTNPSITFRVDSAHVYRDTTVGTSDTLFVGVNVTKGTQDMQAFIVRVSYDGEEPTMTDEIPFDADGFSYEKTIVTRAQAGSERWYFGVVLGNGDLFSRSIKLTVQ
jgi:hypothetical protein